MSLIALTGGIASGKSSIARRFAEHGAVVVDADAVVRELQEPGTPVLAAMVAEFGADILDESGALKRAELGARVFGSPEKVAALNGIVHPAVRAETERRFAEAIAADPDGVIVYDVPLLVEARASDPWDLIIVAHAPAAERIARLIEFRGMSEDEARARVSSQIPDEQRLAIADVVIDTTASLDQTLMEADRVWNDLRPLLRAARERRAVSGTAAPASSVGGHA
ncbi:dephospho-CoA kinase [Microbacterium sp. NC79]|uniref:dephospho-CoA kinase n=1 Tax=Microbacterium sp. NC79 TaxID=2851009 RepID=UPI001C2C2277|nr:dephospho-CoA kinase [Microbacterium sp. NC79]MBV0894806.1 dephospho-CoA kinase, long form [Microbacterium sp. NC79]